MTISRNLSFLAEGVSPSGVLGATYGGTGQSSITTGDLLYGSASNIISKLAIGSTGTILRVVAGVPSWDTDYTGTVTSVAALTLGTTGTDLSSTVANGTTTPVITLNVPTASATNRGALSAADWTTFNNKQPAGTYVTSVTGTAPVVSSGGTTPAISMAAATTSVSGYLTSTDWTTFNNKAPAFTYTTGYVPFGQGTTTPNQSSNLTFDGTTLTSTGFSGPHNGTVGATTANTGLFTTLGATGLVNFGSSGTNGSDQLNMYSNARNFFTMSRASTNTAQNVIQFIKARGTQASRTSVTITDTIADIQFNAFDGTNVLQGATIAGFIDSAVSTGITPTALRFYTQNTSGTFAERMRLDSSGNLQIGQTGGTSRLNIASTGSPQINIVSLDASGVNFNCGANSSTNVYVGTPNGVPLVFNTSGAERCRISAVGGVSVGTTTDAGTGNFLVVGTITANITVNTGGYTVATLPTGVTGARAYVTNALAPTFGATVVGGGAITIPVFYNGANWIVG